MPPSSHARPRPPVQTLDAETAHERHRRNWLTQQSYSHGRPTAPRPSSKRELDILKEKHQFIRDTNVDPSTLSWEDQLALKYYSTLFKEYAVVNLKHYKTGAIALRWRTESEVLAGIASGTCASLRCVYHLPHPDAEEGAAAGEQDAPLVEVELEEYEDVQFSFVEAGESKMALVKLVLCGECGRKMRYGRKKAKEAKEGVARDGGDDKDERETPSSSKRDASPQKTLSERRRSASPVSRRP